MENQTINSVDDLKDVIQKYDAVAIYFSTQYCNVCKVLKPKVKEFLESEFPKVQFFYIDIEENKEIGAEFSVFAVPTMVFFLAGKEAFRKSRNFSLAELFDNLERPYSMLFS